jgi:hypothetical protein
MRETISAACAGLVVLISKYIRGLGSNPDHSRPGSIPDQVMWGWVWGTILQAGRSQIPDPNTWFFFFNLPNPSGRTRPLGVPSLTEMSTRSKKNCFWGVERCRCVRLTNSPPCLIQLSRQCGILNISQHCGSARPVTGIALLLLFSVIELSFLRVLLFPLPIIILPTAPPSLIT